MSGDGWQDFEAEQLAELTDKEFERFCEDLVRFEHFGRHTDPRAIDGPTGDAVPDGGRDFLTTVVDAPRVDRQTFQERHRVRPLTQDPVGGARTRTAYSCKAGHNWLKLALTDASGGNTGNLGKRSAEVLADGGFFKLLINVPGKLDAPCKRDDILATPEEHLLRVFSGRIGAMADERQLGPRIEILDANTLSAFLRGVRPEGLDRWLERFRLRPVLRSLGEWRSLHREQRTTPAFEEDEARASLREQLRGLLESSGASPADRCACVLGPPGVGKTRLLLEALAAEAAIAQRVRVAAHPNELKNLGEVLRRHPGGLLVVDDCLPLEADDLGKRFRARAHDLPEAFLILLTPASSQADNPVPNTFPLQPLASAQAQALIAREIGDRADSQDVAALAELSEGYPWFARLLAEQYRHRNRAPQNMREAVTWALVSPREAADLDALARRRARAMLAVSLTPNTDWDRLDEQARNDLVKAVQLADWPTLVDASKACADRGLIRRRQGWRFKYVTPQVLEREIINWLLGPEGSPGSRSAVSEHANAYLDRFIGNMEALGVSDSVLDGFAATLLEELENASSWDDLAGLSFLGPQLHFVARRLPRPTLAELSQRVAASDPADLRARSDVRFTILPVVQQLATRRGCFDGAESILFLLAEMHAAPGSRAQEVWGDLFHVELNATHAGIEHRMNVVSRRVRDPSASRRRLALEGVARVLATGQARRAADLVDAPWPSPTVDEALWARTLAWALLAECIGDSDSEVATKAKELALQELRSMVRFGLAGDSLRTLRAVLGRFGPRERVALACCLESIRAYDQKWLGAAERELRELEAALRPTNFRERLQRHVGAWAPAGRRDDEERADVELAELGLHGDAPILQELDWLVSDDAVRGYMFAFALGRADASGVAFDPLQTLARVRRSFAAQQFLGRYVAGMGMAGRMDQVAEAVEVLVRDDALGDAAVLATIELETDPPRLAFIVNALQEDRLSHAVVAELGRRRHWLDTRADADVQLVLDALLGKRSPQRTVAALELAVERAEKRPEALGVLAESLMSCLEQLVGADVDGMADYYWELGAKLLLQRPEYVEPIGDLAVRALAVEEGSNDHVWKTIHAVAERDIAFVWEPLREVLEGDEESAERALVAFRFHRHSFSWPREAVLDWVGDSEQRARAIVSVERPYRAELAPVLRALIQRFGPRSRPAREVLYRMESTDGVVSSVAAHDARQLAHAKSWLDDPDPAVREFAGIAVEALTSSYELNVAREEDDRRRYGT